MLYTAVSGKVRQKSVKYSYRDGRMSFRRLPRGDSGASGCGWRLSKRKKVGESGGEMAGRGWSVGERGLQRGRTMGDGGGLPVGFGAKRHEKGAAFEWLHPVLAV